MAYTESQLEALEAALASGTLRVTFEGRSIEYRSVDELKKAIADPARPRSRVIRAYTSKGF